MSSPLTSATVPFGADAYRRQLRRRGPWLALAPPAALGLLAAALLWNSESPWRGIVGFVVALAAAPLLPVAGVPLRPSDAAMWIAVGASAVLWVAVGVWATRRATNRPAADWSDYWREYRAMTLGVWVGVVMAAVGAAVLLGVVP